MYDKVKLWLPKTRDMPDILQYLEAGKEITDKNTGENIAFGCVGNLKVSVFVGSISIGGSLAKFLYDGSNVYPLDKKRTKEAMDKLSDSLHLNISEAKVTEIEIGANFTMKHLPAEYIKRLGEMPRMARLSIEATSLYYKGKGRKQPKVFTFYDKEADAIAKGMSYPKLGHILRYEMRLKGRLPQQTGTPNVIGSTLYDDSFYRKMARMYQEYYFSISKTNQLKTDAMNEIKTVGDAFDVLVARLINQGNQNQIMEFLDELKANNVFDDQKYYSRLKTKINAVSRKANITMSDELIKELDDEIKNFGAYV